MKMQPHKEQIYEEACRYDKLGDTYNAVKLFKYLIKSDKDWAPPYLALGRIYYKRREWKPCFHYNKKAVALESDNRDSWWMLAIAAVGLKKDRVARSVWSKFGIHGVPKKPEGLRLEYNGMFEILWIFPMSPAKARIISIPHPASGFRYREVVLYDRTPVGHHIVNAKRIPVYAELGSFKRSPFQTFSCLLDTNEEVALSKIETLCQEAGLGFEIWSNAARSMVIENPNAFPEYYGNNSIKKNNSKSGNGGQSLIAIAAIHEAEVQRLLNDWQIITLAQYSDLRAY